MCRRIGFSTLIAAFLFVLPAIARADSFTYTFTTSGGRFSFTVPSLITTDQTLSILPFKLQGVTFEHASVIFFTENSDLEECFLFGTANVTGDDCNFGVSLTPPFSYFGAEFLAATTVGSYTPFGGFCGRDPVFGETCIQHVFSLTISHGSPVPEPSSLVLFGTGVVGLLGVIRRKSRA
jgi:hypothetical protein